MPVPPRHSRIRPSGKRKSSGWTVSQPRREVIPDGSAERRPSERRRSNGHGRTSTGADASDGSCGMGPGRGPSRPGRLARGAEPHPREGPGAGAPRPDDGFAVHLLPGRGQDHGRRPQGHTGSRAGYPAMRRRPPVELRRVRLARARSRSTHASAGGRWRGPTPALGTQSPLRSTWARAMRSTHRSPISPGGTRIRTSGTISSS